MKITGTFLDEISHDIPHQNWGIEEWSRDFRHMKSIGIDTVILIRCGYKKFLSYPSQYLISSQNCFQPERDLLEMFLSLADKHDMHFYFGLYDSGEFWWEHNDFVTELSINKYVIEEVWNHYGHHPSFKGWYISHEISRRTKGVIDFYSAVGIHCKEISQELPVLISPYIDGTKALLSSNTSLSKKESVSLKEHEEEWNEIFDGIQNAVDIVAFQDGHVGLDILAEYFSVNKNLSEKYNFSCWTNAESFDRDMPIKFLPIKWEKLRLKLEAAQKAGLEKAITFEFSHFMSPQSSYPQAHGLFNRYKEYLEKQ